MLQTLGDYEQIVIGKEPNQFRYLWNTGVSLTLQTDSIFTTHRSIFLQSAFGCLPSNYPRHPAMQPSKGWHAARPQILTAQRSIGRPLMRGRLSGVCFYIGHPLWVEGWLLLVHCIVCHARLMPNSWLVWCQPQQAKDIGVLVIGKHWFLFVCLFIVVCRF